MGYPSKLLYKVPNILRGRSVSTIAELQVDTFDGESYTPQGSYRVSIRLRTKLSRTIWEFYQGNECEVQRRNR